MIRAGMIKWGFLVLAAFFALLAAVTSQAQAAGVKKIQLYATDGYHTLPGGKQVYIWGYSLVNEPGSAVFPGPKIEAEEGDTVEVTVTNIGPQKAGADFQVHSLRIDGIDGDPVDSPVLSEGQSETRSITVNQAGSYYYYSGDAKQYGLQMGLNGPFVVKAKDSAKQVWTGGPAYDKEYVFHMNELDPAWHQAAEAGTAYDPLKFHPRYWTINGKSFPDVEDDPESMIHGKVGERIFVRLINPGFDEHPMHLHGHHFQVIAENGKPLPEPIDKDTVDLAPGETKDILIVFEQSGNFPFHSHKILDNTNDGVYPGGLHTMTHIEQAANPAGGTITVTVGSEHATVNGEHVMLDVAPFKLKGDTYIPFQFIAERFGGTIQTGAADRSILYQSANHHIELWPIQKNALMDGEQIPLQSPLLHKKGKPMMPLSFLASYLCAKVTVDASSGAIAIDYQAGQECPVQNDDMTPPTVTAAPGGATYPSAQTVTLTIQDQDPNAKIYYTTDGSAPTASSTVYTGPIPITQTTTLKYIGMDSAGNVSTVGTENYTITPAPEVIVEVLDDKFSQEEIRVKKGTTVTWVLKSSMMHTVTAYDGSFDGIVSPDGQVRFSYTFNTTGTVGYFCMVHPYMTGTVIVGE